MSVSEIYAKLSELQAIIDRDLSNIPRATLPGFEAQKNMARQDIERVRDQYRREVVSAAKASFIQGTPEAVEKFVKLNEGKAGVAILQADELYNRLADPLELMFGSDRLVNGGMASRLIGEMGTIARELNVRELPMPKITQFVGTVRVPTKAELIDLLRRSIRESMGDELNSMYLNNRLVLEAEKRGFNTDSIAVVVTGSTDEERAPLMAKSFHGKSVAVNVDDLNDTANTAGLAFKPEPEGESDAVVGESEPNALFTEEELEVTTATSLQTKSRGRKKKN